MKDMKFYFTVDFPSEYFPRFDYEIDELFDLENCTVEEGLEVLKKLVSDKKIVGKYRSMGSVEIKDNNVSLSYESCEGFSDDPDKDDNWVGHDDEFFWV
jgi:hypothetical protein